MSLTPLAYFALVESQALSLLPAAAPGTEWRFQRFLNYHEKNGSMQLLLAGATSEPRLLGVVSVHQHSDETGTFLKGWFQAHGVEQRHAFVLYAPVAARIEEQTYDLVDKWAQEIAQALNAPPPAEQP